MIEIIGAIILGIGVLFFLLSLAHKPKRSKKS